MSPLLPQSGPYDGFDVKNVPRSLRNPAGLNGNIILIVLQDGDELFVADDPFLEHNHPKKLVILLLSGKVFLDFKGVLDVLQGAEAHLDRYLAERLV